MKELKYFILRICFILVILFQIITSKTIASVLSDTISFIHITDTHVIFNLPGYHPNIQEKRKHFGENVKPLEQFCKTVQNTIHPDFMVITGDVIDFFEAETPEGTVVDTQVEQVLRLLDANLFPVYISLGNHDIASDYSDKESYITSQITAERARAAWIRNAPCFKDGTYYSKVFEADSTSYRLIFLDDSYYAVERKKDGSLPFITDKPQLYWLDDQIKKSDKDIEIIFMHMPLPFKDEDFIRLANADSAKNEFTDLYTLIKDKPSVRLIFMGHNHTNIIKDLQFLSDHKLTQVQTAAFGYDPNNWRLIKLTGNSILISNPGKTEIQLVIPVR